MPGAKAKAAHVFERQATDWYQEPEWVSRRLFEVEDFEGPILDPCCGAGRVLASARACGLETYGSDIVDRRPMLCSFRIIDFLKVHPEDVMNWNWMRRSPSIVGNPPFRQFREFTERALSLATHKVAFIWPLARLPAAGAWLGATPLARVYCLTPRPSMPSGEHIQAGGKVGGGTVDFAFLVWAKQHKGPPTIHWLHRDK